MDIPDTGKRGADSKRTYVLITAARNEEAFIEKTLMSVVSQTVLPQRWVIVSDGSTDNTNQIVEAYAQQYGFITLLPLSRRSGRNFGSKVLALHEGIALLSSMQYEFIGNVDADVSFEPFYFEELMRECERNDKLGLLAGFVHEEQGGQFRRRSSNRVDSVPHCAQLLRRKCFEDIQGYAVLRHGGEDWYAQTCARMSGWEARALPRLPICHHRRTGDGSNVLKDRFRLGRLDYSFGSDPVFEMCKCLVRWREAPYVVGAMTRFTGFVWSYLCHDERPVSKEFIAFLRSEQKLKKVSFFRYFERLGIART